MRRTKPHMKGEAPKKKLGVERTTLRTLNQADLAQVAGGTRNSGKYCGITQDRG